MAVTHDSLHKSCRSANVCTAHWSIFCFVKRTLSLQHLPPKLASIVSEQTLTSTKDRREPDLHRDQPAANRTVVGMAGITTTCHYSVLGIAHDAASAEIKKAFREVWFTSDDRGRRW
jgi:hypothetical protein